MRYSSCCCHPRRKLGSSTAFRILIRYRIITFAVLVNMLPVEHVCLLTFAYLVGSDGGHTNTPPSDDSSSHSSRDLPQHVRPGSIRRRLGTPNRRLGESYAGDADEEGESHVFDAQRSQQRPMTALTDPYSTRHSRSNGRRPRTTHRERYNRESKLVEECFAAQ